MSPRPPQQGHNNGVPGVEARLALPSPRALPSPLLPHSEARGSLRAGGPLRAGGLSGSPIVGGGGGLSSLIAPPDAGRAPLAAARPSRAALDAPAGSGRRRTRTVRRGRRASGSRPGPPAAPPASPGAGQNRRPAGGPAPSPVTARRTPSRLAALTPPASVTRPSRNVPRPATNSGPVSIDDQDSGPRRVMRRQGVGLPPLRLHPGDDPVGLMPRPRHLPQQPKTPLHAVQRVGPHGEQGQVQTAQPRQGRRIGDHIPDNQIGPQGHHALVVHPHVPDLRHPPRRRGVIAVGRVADNALPSPSANSISVVAGVSDTMRRRRSPLRHPHAPRVRHRDGERGHGDRQEQQGQPQQAFHHAFMM